MRLAVLGLVGHALSARFAMAPPSTDFLFDIRSFGARGDGKSIDSPATNEAIAAAAKAGGTCWLGECDDAEFFRFRRPQNAVGTETFATSVSPRAALSPTPFSSRRLRKRWRTQGRRD
jgi:hypothetical protein